MASSSSSFCLRVLVMFSLVCIAFSADLYPTFYKKSCPGALQAIKRVVADAVMQERRMGASLLRLHFHDCFVNGCDGSVLLDPTSTIDSEKNANPNNNSARGFDVVDRIKAEVDKECGGPVVSCADILAVAARDSVVELGGPYWPVLLGRRDSTNASRIDANNDIPSPIMNLPALIANFKKHGLSVEDLVVLSGSHTIGFAQCRLFRPRIYSSANIDPTFARKRQATCPLSGNDTNLAPLDAITPTFFDTKYFNNLVNKRGLLISDQALFNGSQTDNQVKGYSSDISAFFKDFARSMIKMGNLEPLTGDQGQIRVNCRRVN